MMTRLGVEVLQAKEGAKEVEEVEVEVNSSRWNLSTASVHE